MRLPLSWLAELCDVKAEPAAIAEALTRLGIEVEGLERPAAAVSGIVVGQIEEIKPHPDADRLRLLTVDIGAGKRLGIVCGASNMNSGDKVAVATIGARLPGGVRIKKSRIRGIDSQGMCCSAAELGLAKAAAGILILPADAPIGAPVAEVLAMEEAIFDLSITPNRGDCMSVYGLARELAAFFGCDLHLPVFDTIESDRGVAAPAVAVADTGGCPLYLARRIDDVAIQDSPAWMQTRLLASGMRPVNGVVDVLNYVMLELGQPMHAFDSGRLQGDIRVRRAEPGEAFQALDERYLELHGDDLVVADAAGPVALAGVMGSLHSGVTSATRRLLLEAAVFKPACVSLTARRHGMVSEASMRFERGVDALLVELALARASQLIVSLFGGSAGAVTACGDVKPLIRPTQVRLELGRMQDRLGAPVPPETDRVLERMGFVIKRGDDIVELTVPSHRHDVRLVEDVIEEYARVYGYDNIPETLPSWPMRMARAQHHGGLNDAVAIGFGQVISYAFTAAGEQRHFVPDAAADVVLANPISQDMAVMRRSLWPGLLNAARHNLNRQQAGVALVEHGRTYARVGGHILEQEALAWLLAGEAEAAEWYRRERSADFFDLKGALEAWCGRRGLAVAFAAADGEPGLQPGQCATLMVGKQAIGRMGRVDANVAAGYGIEVPVYVAEVWLDRLPATGQMTYTPLAEHPLVMRDLVFLFDAKLQAAEIVAAARSAGGKLLRQVRVFDRYVGQGVPAGKVSLGLRLTLQAADHTLTQDEAESIVNHVITHLHKTFAANLRGG